MLLIRPDEPVALRGLTSADGQHKDVRAQDQPRPPLSGFLSSRYRPPDGGRCEHKQVSRLIAGGCTKEVVFGAWLPRLVRRQAITAVVESWVREHPEQWLWLHRCWR